MSEIVVGTAPGTGETGTTARFRNTIAYDALARAPLVLWFGLCSVPIVHQLLADVETAQGFGLAVSLQVLSRIAALGFILCVIGALCLRLPPIARAAGLLPRLAAIGGAFSITALALLPRFEMPPAVAGASLMLMLLGYGLACYALGHLGRSLSIMAEARRLVTSGPYALVRHPLYAAEAIASLGVLLQFLSPAAVVLWVVHIALQCCRMRYEEQILQLTFPEYQGYAKRVARWVPGVY